MGMTNWKRLYTDASRMLDKYQNEVGPKLREQLANSVEVVHRYWDDSGRYQFPSGKKAIR